MYYYYRSAVVDAFHWTGNEADREIVPDWLFKMFMNGTAHVDTEPKQLVINNVGTAHLTDYIFQDKDKVVRIMAYDEFEDICAPVRIPTKL